MPEETLLPLIEVKIMQAPDHYGILWLKRVTGFNPKYHCVRSLVGSYSSILPGKGEREPDVLYAGIEDASTFDYLYLCGVHLSFNLDLNLHVPMRYKEGASFAVLDDGVDAAFTNAEALLVPPLPAEFDLTDDVAFTRCRNYQFGYNAYGRDPNVVLALDEDS